MSEQGDKQQEEGISLDPNEQLNEAHVRGTLNEPSAKQQVYSASALLENWLRVIR